MRRGACTKPSAVDDADWFAVDLAKDELESVRTYNQVKEPSGVDLFVFVYPQEVASKIGDVLMSRVIDQELLPLGDGAFVVGAQAVFVGERELADEPILKRILGEGLGFNPPNDLRPFIDGRCTDPGDAKCGADIGVQ